MFGWGGNKNKTEPEELSFKTHINKKLVTLIILDGLGIHPDPLGNAVYQARTPFLDTIWTRAKSTLVGASGIKVGLPDFEPGNSEVGHLNMGSGEVVYQSLPKINDAIANGTFGENPELKKMFVELHNRGSNLHIMGILSAGGVHGHIKHLFTILDVCKKESINPFIHIFMDGRDTGPNEGAFYLEKLNEKIADLGIGKIASISGRLYAMDRDQRWERTEKAYAAIVGYSDNKVTNPMDYLKTSYSSGVTDQIILPATVVDQNGFPVGPVKDNDAILFYNFREDRSRQMTKAFVMEEVDMFNRKIYPANLYFVSMMGYSSGLNNHVLYQPPVVGATLASVLSEHGLYQLHISETEKNMHVTYFFNGGVEKPHAKEQFFNIPSPKVFDYAKTPEMSAKIVTDEVVYRLEHLGTTPYSFIVVNLANPDMMGHTGNLQAGILGVEFSDLCVRRMVTKTVENGGAAIIIADHGNCETMIDRITKKIDTFHNANPVPFILVSSPDEYQFDPSIKTPIEKVGTGPRATPTGILADVAPTILSILDLPKPLNMSGIDLQTII